jgi:hypothetical protein
MAEPDPRFHLYNRRVADLRESYDERDEDDSTLRLAEAAAEEAVAASEGNGRAPRARHPLATRYVSVVPRAEGRNELSGLDV